MPDGMQAIWVTLQSLAITEGVALPSGPQNVSVLL